MDELAQRSQHIQALLARSRLEQRAILRYFKAMAKAELKRDRTGKWVVRDSRSGRFIEVRGANSMSSSALLLNEGVDLTKPIAVQALGRAPDKLQKQMKKG